MDNVCSKFFLACTQRATNPTFLHVSNLKNIHNNCGNNKKLNPLSRERKRIRPWFSDMCSKGKESNEEYGGSFFLQAFSAI